MVRQGWKDGPAFPRPARSASRCFLAGLVLLVGAASVRASDGAAPKAERKERAAPGVGVGRSGSDNENVARVVSEWFVESGQWLAEWHRRTPPLERVTWGGMAACAALGVVVLIERLVRLRRGGVVPRGFTERFVDRLHEGKLDCGQALDHCERNPSPAARVALAAVRRWGRPASDLERAVTLAHRVETERLRQNVGTLRRVAVLAAMLGVLGTLSALGRVLASLPNGPGPTTIGPNVTAPPAGAPSWGPELAATIAPLSAGLVIATLALVAYDGVFTRVEALSGALDRLGAETIEAVALAAPAVAPPLATVRAPLATPRPGPASSPHLRI